MASRAALLALLALGLALVGWALFARESDEEAIRRRLAELADVATIRPDEGVVARALRVKEGVEDRVAPEAALSLAELGERLDREALVGVTVQAAQRWRSGRVALDDVAVALRGADAAHVDAVARVETAGGGEPRSDTRPVAIELAKRDGEWVVTAIDVAPREGDGDAEDE